MVFDRFAPPSSLLRGPGISCPAGSSGSYFDQTGKTEPVKIRGEPRAKEGL
jgi:hypothetical protein